MSQTYNLSLTPEKSFVVDLSVSGGVDNYEKLKNLPTLNGVELKGDLTGVDVGLVGRDELPPVEEIATKSEIPDVSGFALTSQLPTKTSQLTNDSDFAYKSELPVVPTQVSAFENDKGYLTQHQDISHLATKTELSSKANKSDIPTKVSAFENDMGYLTQHQDISNLATKAELNSKANKSDIPTKTSQLTNDSGFVTKEEIGDIDIDSPVLEEAKQIIDKYAIPNRILDTENVKSYSSVADGYLNALGTINSSSTRGTSDYIDLAEYPLGIHIKSGVAGVKDGGYTYACFYDENKVFISNLVGAHGDLGEQDIFNYPENAKYIRLTLTAKGTPLKLMAYYGDEYYDYDIARETDLNTVTAEVNDLTERLGDLVIEAKNISKAYGDRVLIDDLSFKIPKGAIVGIIGPNGAGKTTLFRMITGQEQPDSGEIRLGETVDLGYVDQSRDELSADKNVWEEISDGLDMIKLGKGEVPSRAYVGQFNFKGSDQQKKVGQLSGGERNRVHLAKMLKKGANVILLDEPTNDLDVDTLRSLEEGIMQYPGCVLVTSHDRWFLDRLATHILAYEDEGHVEWFEGNFEEYEKDKVRRLGEDALRPHRSKHKTLTRQ